MSNSSRAQGQRVKHEGACCKLHKQEPNADLMAEEAGLGSRTAAGLAAAVPPAQTAASSAQNTSAGRARRGGDAAVHAQLPEPSLGREPPADPAPWLGPRAAAVRAAVIRSDFTSTRLL